MRAWLIAAVLLILPLIVYWPTVSHEYGFRDDYAHLREVRERPGWLTELTSSNGRPVYGVVLEASLRDVDDVHELEDVALSEHGAARLRRPAALVASAAHRLDRDASRGARRRGDVIAGRAGRRGVGHRLADRARTGCGRCRVRARRPRAPAKGSASWVQVAAGSGLYLVAASPTRRAHCSRSCCSRPYCSFVTARQRARCEVGHRAHRCVVRQLGRRVPRDEPRVHRRCRSRSRADGHRAAPIHQVAMVFPQPSSQLDRVVCAAR